jgi:putative tryptophan/tyrosine transport system substrate-binding protein
VTIRPREFITLFGGTVVAWQRFAWAEQRRLVGVLWTDRSAVESFSFDAALRRGFAEAGFIEGSNIAFAERYAGSDLARITGELSALKPDVIVASGSSCSALIASVNVPTLVL